ncbi:hypothetical protein D3C73_951050 [compost metagenome]
MLKSDPFAPPDSESRTEILEGNLQTVHRSILENPIISQHRQQHDINVLISLNVLNDKRRFTFLLSGSTPGIGGKLILQHRHMINFPSCPDTNRV